MSNREEARASEIYERFQKRSSKDDEYNDWAEYRAQLTEFILKHTRSGASLLIAGAGKCNDMDLRTLQEHCGSITLSDYRPETAEEAFRRYGLERSEKSQFLQSDYVGIPDEDYRKYTLLLLRVMKKLQAESGTSLEDIVGAELQELEEELTRIYRENEAYRFSLGDKV
jgi:hypothetical protein